jgi:formate hydrogenlyase transcriptional activator
MFDPRRAGARVERLGVSAPDPQHELLDSGYLRNGPYDGEVQTRAVAQSAVAFLHKHFNDEALLDGAQSALSWYTSPLARRADARTPDRQPDSVGVTCPIIGIREDPMTAAVLTNDNRRYSPVEEGSARETHMAREEACVRQSEPEIIGDSAKLRHALQEVETVAPTSSTVVILGETGTGKDLVARTIHNLSQRRQHAFVKLNCAAIPLDLLESELFGHERGAFTGAIAQRIGRFELAHNGTLFLDEIGDIPPGLQPKLLRVLQEQEFERLGSTRTIHTSVRIIAATHRNLTQMVEDGKFRVDLYYRLNVFPITVPPLRDRLEDIPQLVRHFTRKYAQQLNRQIEVIPQDAMEVLMQYPWPGNIRELQNFIERAVILSRGSVLEPPLHELIRMKAEASAEPVTLRDAERAHILRILRKANGQLAGAAVLLGVPRSTLFYKMRRLGISLPRTRKAAKTAAAAS